MERDDALRLSVSLLPLYNGNLHISVALLAAYTVILLLGNGYATDESNIALRIDKAILGDSHLYRHSPIDPEGLLGTIAAIAHALIGFWCGRAIVQAQDASGKVTNALIPGACLVLGGYLLSYALPPNKSIWSPSFVLLTTGLASLLLGILIHAIDTRNHCRWTRPFLVFGVNPLFPLHVQRSDGDRWLADRTVRNALGRSHSHLRHQQPLGVPLLRAHHRGYLRSRRLVALQAQAVH